MGLLRFIFALSVLLFHLGSLKYTIVNNQIAVCSFFVISGFYMALILEKKYFGQTVLFWTNRALRIFPLYWITLGVTFAFVLLKFYFHLGNTDNAIIHYLRYSSGVSPFIFWENLINYIMRNLSLIVTTDYSIPNDNTPGLLLVQQAWTLQIELIFYILAPLIIHLSKKKFLLMSSIYICIYFGLIVPFHMISEKTLIFIFLNYFIFFLLGVGSFRCIYQKIRDKKYPKKALVTIFTGFVIFLFTYSFLPVTYTFFSKNIMDIVYFILLSSCLPFIFSLTTLNTIDLFIGDLSYPLYITHFFVIKLFANMQNVQGKTWDILVVSILVAIGAALFVERPLDTWRQNRVRIVKSGVKKKKNV